MMPLRPWASPLRLRFPGQGHLIPVLGFQGLGNVPSTSLSHMGLEMEPGR